jgi:hypothetical protein
VKFVQSDGECVVQQRRCRDELKRASDQLAEFIREHIEFVDISFVSPNSSEVSVILIFL